MLSPLRAHSEYISAAKLRLYRLKLSKLLCLDNLVSNSRPFLFEYSSSPSLFAYTDANGDGRKLGGKHDVRTRLLTAQPYSARVEVAPFNGTHRRKNVSARSSSLRRLDAGPISVRFRLEWNQTAAAGAPIPCGVRRLWPPTATFLISSRNAAAVVSQENCRLQLKAPSDNRVCRSVSRAKRIAARAIASGVASVSIPVSPSLTASR
jgi:hypothetical protein